MNDGPHGVGAEAVAAHAAPPSLNALAAEGFRGFLTGVTGPIASRRWRVGTLLSAVVLMGVTDLLITLEFLMIGAMWEDNPIARSVMSYESPEVLALWKMVSLTPLAYVTLRYGQRALCEVAVWVCFVAMAVVMVRWSMYCGVADTMPFVELSMTPAQDHDWVLWQTALE